MEQAHEELERFTSNSWQGRAPGLWVTLRIDLGHDADAVQARFLEVIDRWLHLAGPIHRQYGFPCSGDDFPAPEAIAPELPAWLIDDFRAFTDDEVRQSEWRFFYESWVWSMAERCWNWWGYERSENTLIVQLQVDGWPCPTEELVYLARVAGAESASVDD